MALRSRSGTPRAELSTLSESELLVRAREQPVPRHVAIIMDGNGRWATRRGPPRVAGPRERGKAARDNPGLTLVMAFNYGGRDELLEAVRALAVRVQAGELVPAAISEADVSAALYTRDIPDPDLLIRTSGEMRVSNFLLWQIAYTELWITPTLWPDFGARDLYRALVDFQGRTRRFGGV